MSRLDRELAAELAGRIDATPAFREHGCGALLHGSTFDWLVTSTRSDVLFFLESHRLLDAVFPCLPQEPEQVEDGPDSPLLRLARARIDMARAGLENVCVG